MTSPATFDTINKSTASTSCQSEFASSHTIDTRISSSPSPSSPTASSSRLSLKSSSTPKENSSSSSSSNDGVEMEEEEEPMLKYARLGASVSNILKSDSATAFLPHDKFLCLGTLSGCVYVLDLNGNEIMRFNVHIGAVNDLALDNEAELLATAGQDSNVYIIDLYSKEQHKFNYTPTTSSSSSSSSHSTPPTHNTTTTTQLLLPLQQHFNRPSVNSVALPEHYRQNPCFVLGSTIPPLSTSSSSSSSSSRGRQWGGEVVMSSRGWFSQKFTAVHGGEGAVSCVRWRKDLLAWSNRAGVKLYDVTTTEPLAFVARPNYNPSNNKLPNSNSITPHPSSSSSSSSSTSSSSDDTCWLTWASNDTLLMAWSQTVNVGVVRTKRLHDRPSNARPDAPTRLLQIVASFNTDYYICGIAPFGENLLLLAYPSDSDTDSQGDANESVAMTSPPVRNSVSPPPSSSSSSSPVPPYSNSNNSTVIVTSRPAPRPELRIVTRENEPISGDALPIHGFQTCSRFSYRLSFIAPNAPLLPTATPAVAAATNAVYPPSLVASPSFSSPSSSSLSASSVLTSSSSSSSSSSGLPSSADSVFYVVSPHDIVIAKPCDADDHITYLLHSNRFAEAYEAAERTMIHLRHHRLLDVGDAYLNHLFSIEHYNEAALLCPRLLKQDKNAWEKWVNNFIAYKQVKVLTPFIPTSSPQLAEQVYEDVLAQYLEQHQDNFLELIHEWTHHIYSVPRVIEAVVNYMENAPSQPSPHVQSGLAELYLITKQFARALPLWLNVGRRDIFQLIRALNLYPYIDDKILRLMLFDRQQAIDLFIDNIHVISVRQVVDALARERELLHHYLHALFKKDSAAATDFADLQLELYAEFGPSELLNFLRSSTKYTLELALKICEKRALWRETVYLLRRMGNSLLALQLLIERVGDVSEAISFVEEDRDTTLWDELITRSLLSPSLLSQLLDHVGSHVQLDLAKLIQRIPANMQIPNLRSKLSHIMTDCARQVGVIQACADVTRADVDELIRKYERRARRAVKVTQDTKCSICDHDIVRGRQPTLTENDVVVFFCRHTYHQFCLQQCASESGSPLACIKCSRNNTHHPR